jgi:hypothetical protein
MQKYFIAANLVPTPMLRHHTQQFLKHSYTPFSNSPTLSLGECALFPHLPSMSRPNARARMQLRVFRQPITDAVHGVKQSTEGTKGTQVPSVPSFPSFPLFAQMCNQ